MTRFSRPICGFSTRTLLIAALGLLGVAPASRADLASYDSFSYTPGQALAGMNGGTGFAGGWRAGSLGADNSAAYQVQASSLGGGPLPSAGGRVSALAQYSLGSGLTRDLAAPIGQANSTVYISMLLRADGALTERASGGFFCLLLHAPPEHPATGAPRFT